MLIKYVWQYLTVGIACICAYVRMFSGFLWGCNDLWLEKILVPCYTKQNLIFLCIEIAWCVGSKVEFWLKTTVKSLSLMHGSIKIRPV